ncbi:serine/threonine protein kinase [Streptomyces triticagri]|uniref:non-specific serine/threonine protein kinase n=1 Tax=Streptomyces triticagri TaxID=2293568 RepID=A0A372M8V7_9ACTN|nr:serine/threonine-protein kinase [Streptomyces triticagri]RFU87321.1 serine/threonine protein kinase [Streptomyces triticagri]
MGTVWRARDELLHREVAVKEVRAPAGLPAPDVERLYARLEREAWAAARITHRGVVTVFDVAIEEGRPWIVMELVRGISLAEALDAEGPCTARRSAHIGAELLSALRAAHEAGVLHRDVKPGNVLLANDGRVVLTDFGIARVEGSSPLTLTGEMVGSPEFLAPEQALGRPPVPESDLWSLGVLLYATVEGHSPFRQDTPLSTLRAVVDDELPPPHRAGLLAPVVEGLLHKDPARRLSPDDAERDLRLIAAGGAPRGSGTTARDRPAAGTPTVTGGTPAAQSASDPSPGRSGPDGSDSPAGSGRSRRAVVLIVAGAVALLLAVGGLAYVLSDRAGGGGSGGDGGTGQGGSEGNRQGADEGRAGGGAGGAGSPTPDDDGTGGGSGDSGGSDGSGAGDGEDGSDGGGDATTPPPQSVRAHVMAVRKDYTGTCPPPEAEAPSFRATLTVGRTPAEVEYRWVTGNGEPSDPDWKTLRFTADGGKVKEVAHTETGHDPDGAVRNRIGVEVRRPVAVRSETIAYSLTCEQEPPTGGGSYTPNAR